jgi:hypothetical protein
MKIITIILFPSLVLATVLYVYNHYSQPTSNQEQIIANIMNYQMPDVIKRCQKDYGYTDDDMNILEQELKRYLAMSALRQKSDRGTGMYSKDVDKLWHSFILFTKEYAAFCNEYVGHFIHHAPEIDTMQSRERKAAMRRDFQAFIKNYEDTFKVEAHPIWFLDMCENDITMS